MTLYDLQKEIEEYISSHPEHKDLPLVTDEQENMHTPITNLVVYAVAHNGFDISPYSIPKNAIFITLY